VAAAAGLLSTPQPPMGVLKWASARGRGRDEVGRVRGLQVGSWCISWAVARRRLGVGGGKGVRERGK
jgi:hypothetical protein